MGTIKFCAAWTLILTDPNGSMNSISGQKNNAAILHHFKHSICFGKSHGAHSAVYCSEEKKAGNFGF